MSALQMVDLDEQSSWPAAVTAYAEHWAQRLCGTTSDANDLEIPLEEDDQFRLLFCNMRLRAIHCTRLLAHERAMVIKQGLRPAGPDLIEDRVRAAHGASEITSAERDMFLAGHLFAAGAGKHWTRQAKWRGAQVCLIISRHQLDEDWTGVEPLLTTWGGEILYFPLRGQHGARLRSLDSPSLIVAALDIADERHRVHSLSRLFVGARLGLYVAGEIFYRAPVPPEDIVGIYQPGDPEYDRHTHLPRA